MENLMLTSDQETKLFTEGYTSLPQIANNNISEEEIKELIANKDKIYTSGTDFHKKYIKEKNIYAELKKDLTKIASKYYKSNSTYNDTYEIEITKSDSVIDTVSLNVLENDTGVDDLTIVSVVTPTDNDGNPLGSVAISSDGKQILFTPVSGSAGENISFTYSTSDGVTTDSATVSVDIKNDTPSIELTNVQDFIEDETSDGGSLLAKENTFVEAFLKIFK